LSMERMVLSLTPVEKYPFSREMNILLEMLIVGLVLIPMYWVSEKLVGSYGKWVTVAVAGALFHGIFEVTGLNAAYVAGKK
jgi:hypothetical protein